MAQNGFFWTQMNAYDRRRLILWFAAHLQFLIVFLFHICLSGSQILVVSAGRAFLFRATSFGLQNG
jgi:hypothetical protein